MLKYEDCKFPCRNLMLEQNLVGKFWDFLFGIGGKVSLLFKICFNSRFTGRTIRNVINMGSYNYLGFAETDVNALKTVTIELKKYGTGVCSTRQEMGE